MLDEKTILAESNKLLDILGQQGYMWGTIEINWDSRARRRKIQIHQYEKQGENKTVRVTYTIIE